ncbi:hypothetical protein JHK82_015310 [Glycine max]|uniref:Uncharacterized protein n=2 Tax=Glycine subgen. Soja TaxID=1462606 RepID=A0A0R0JH53_SOYBN|nr:hypothetical protein JHK87_015234 [Glycine soja]KAG5031713.1 hypothetical protein JHK85_015695 [Glycine max]KAG5045929.1 hypothetical protein JHK86_015335 [Glycine max]KAG5148429.1 hypothetical protein JHK82_015310 [Glycine max]KAH1125955.1 hypothetical protein GYH30_015130 [Glycine max]
MISPSSINTHTHTHYHTYRKIFFQKTFKSTPLKQIFASPKRTTTVGEREKESAKENSLTDKGGNGWRRPTTSDQ